MTQQRRDCKFANNVSLKKFANFAKLRLNCCVSFLQTYTYRLLAARPRHNDSHARRAHGCAGARRVRAGRDERFIGGRGDGSAECMKVHDDAAPGTARRGDGRRGHSTT
jgi:hypothetical protein